MRSAASRRLGTASRPLGTASRRLGTASRRLGTASRWLGPAAPGSARLWWIATALAVAGVLVAANMLQATVRGIQPICLAGDCSRVASSPTSRLFGIPISAWGCGMFLALAGLAASGARHPGHRRRRSTALFALSIFGAAFIGYIVWYQAAILDAVCASCTTSLILLLALAVVSGVVARASVR
jgi:uncharacterized membrane protein